MTVFMVKQAAIASQGELGMISLMVVMAMTISGVMLVMIP